MKLPRRFGPASPRWPEALACAREALALFRRDAVIHGCWLSLIGQCYSLMTYPFATLLRSCCRVSGNIRPLHSLYAQHHVVLGFISLLSLSACSA
ncbi:hypothetical protein ALP24_05036, partial [Pseudomonas syringae pv. aptata]